jgi:hypothetical protein
MDAMDENKEKSIWVSGGQSGIARALSPKVAFHTSVSDLDPLTQAGNLYTYRAEYLS